jgi:CDP-glucose 4,6-dehydratase
MKINTNFKNKTVFITGHTGFKGSWLLVWLDILGAKIIGYSKDIPSKPSLFLNLKIAKKIKHIIGDIRDYKLLKKNIIRYKPDFIFHLAGQSLVNKSYKNPKETWETNAIGTLNLLESARALKKKCSIVIITSDKVYRNLEIKRGYSENYELGGYDPYSASKGGAEFVIRSYIKSFFNTKNRKVNIAVARAGNVIGGGDWSANRILPDCFKKWSKNKIVQIRNPNSTRPWQHVLETINGYLILSLKLNKKPNKFHGEIFNFGPKNNTNYSVNDLLNKIKKFYKDARWKYKKNDEFYESKLLKLNSNKAIRMLNWKNKLSLNETVQWVSMWYKNFYSKDLKKKIATLNYTREQIKKFIKKK